MSRVSEPAASTTDVEEVVAEAVRLLGQRGELILNAVDDGIYCLDAAGRATFVNEAAARKRLARRRLFRRVHWRAFAWKVFVPAS